MDKFKALETYEEMNDQLQQIKDEIKNFYVDDNKMIKDMENQMVAAMDTKKAQEEAARKATDFDSENCNSIKKPLH